MLPGKQYKPEDIFAVARRYWWVILLPFVVVSAGTAVWSQVLPDRYRSDALVQLVPQRVPESYVRSTVTGRVEDRLQAISQQILSRTQLERMIQEFNLYEEQLRTGIIQDVVERMRNDIGVDIVRGDAFRVSYTSDNAVTAMTVAERLTSLFIEESLRDREALAQSTSEFLSAQLEDARRRLVEQEAKLATYQRRYAGQLPSQAQSNLQVVQNTQMQIQALLQSIDADRNRRLAGERALADLDVPENEPVMMLAGEDEFGVPVGGPIQAQLAGARQALETLQTRLTPEHPDVVRMRRLVAELEARAEAEALAVPLTGAAAADLTPAELARRNRRLELEAELANLDRQLVDKQEEVARLRAVGADYQARVEAVPGREAEMAELTRDYATLQEVYTSLLSKQEDSKVAMNLERRQIGQQMRVLDPARLPERPFSPNRLRINLLGSVFGLALGVGLVALLEYRDTAFRTDAEVAAVLSLPVLARIPRMMNESDRRRRRMRRLAVSAGVATILLFVAVGGVAWRMGLLDGLVR